jgi:hypothetical protein
VATETVRNLFVNSDYSLSEKMRLRRWGLINRLMPDLSEMKVLDLGGTKEWWLRAPVRPRHVTVMNLGAEEQTSWITTLTGDACYADKQLKGQSFDLVFSNSLIEHVGGHKAWSSLAQAIRSLAPRYVIQTPYRYFPIEPHWLFPGFQFLPLPLRAGLAPRWPLGHTRGWPAAQARDEAMSTQLLTATEMRSYFPDGTLYWERFLGLPKSMLLVR